MRAFTALLLAALCLGVATESKAEETTAQRAARVALLKQQLADPKAGTFVKFADGSVMKITGRDGNAIRICSTGAIVRCGDTALPFADADFAHMTQVFVPGSPGYQDVALQVLNGM
jgi:hypothetical protein